MWAAANTCVKLSILSLYAITFPSKRFTRLCHATMAVSVAYFLVILLETFLICRPVQFTWDKSIPNGQCPNQNLASLLLGSINFLIDAFIVALPIPKLSGLQIPLAKRVAIGAMFCLGAVLVSPTNNYLVDDHFPLSAANTLLSIRICILSLLRNLAILPWKLRTSTSSSTAIAIYTLLEPTLGVVNACLPTTRPALRVLFKSGPFSWGQKSFRDDSHHNSSNTQGSYQSERFEDNLHLGRIEVVSNRQAVPPQDGNIVVLREWDISLSPT